MFFGVLKKIFFFEMRFVFMRLFEGVLSFFYIYFYLFLLFQFFSFCNKVFGLIWFDIWMFFIFV